MLVNCTNDNWIVIVRWMLCAMFPGEGPGMLHTLPYTPVPTPTFILKNKSDRVGVRGTRKLQTEMRKNQKLLCKQTLKTYWAPKQVCLCMYKIAEPWSHLHYRSWTYDIWNLVVSMWVFITISTSIINIGSFPTSSTRGEKLIAKHKTNKQIGHFKVNVYDCQISALYISLFLLS